MTTDIASTIAGTTNYPRGRQTSTMIKTQSGWHPATAGSQSIIQVPQTTTGTSSFHRAFSPMTVNLSKVISPTTGSTGINSSQQMMQQVATRAQTVQTNVQLQQVNVNQILQELESSLENRSSDLDDYQGPKIQTLEPMMIHGTGQKLKPKEVSKKLSPKSSNLNKKVIYTYEQKNSGDEQNISKKKKGQHQHGFSSHSGTALSNMNESSKFVTLDPPTTSNTNLACA